MAQGRSGLSPQPMGPRSFWIGLPVMLFFVGVTIGGAYYALSQVYLEWQLDHDGVSVQGTLLEKKVLSDDDRTTYHFRYSFSVDAQVITNESRVDADAYYAGRKGEPIQVLYLPGHPERNLPAMRHMSRFFVLCGAISAVAATFFLVVCIGMIVKKLKGGYRALEAE